MSSGEQLAADLIERALSVFERLAADVRLMRTDLNAVADKLATLDASVDALVLASARKTDTQ